MANPLIRVLLVDDHTVVRLGLASLFGTVEHFEVVGQAGGAAQAVAEAVRCQPDVVVMDVRLPDSSGVEACREIRSRCPHTRVVMLTSYADDDAVVASIMAGAVGYQLKHSEPERLIDAVEAAARGESLLDPVATEVVLARMRDGGPVASDPFGALSQQERRILPLIAEGATNRQIARELLLSEHTIKSYVSNILQKLHLNRRAEAAAFIARRGRDRQALPIRSPTPEHSPGAQSRL